jgi:hypothetical protein
MRLVLRPAATLHHCTQRAGPIGARGGPRCPGGGGRAQPGQTKACHCGDCATRSEAGVPPPSVRRWDNVPGGKRRTELD